MATTRRVVHPGAIARYRAMQCFAATLVLFYALAVLFASWRSPDLGFVLVHGGRITHVEPAPEAAGLRPGDTIVAINGRPIATSLERAENLWAVAPGVPLALTVERTGEQRAISYTPPRVIPLAPAAGFLLAALLLTLALLADRGYQRGHPQIFFRATLVYVVFMAGCFSFEIINHNVLLYVPWIFAVNLAAPLTCHLMLMFPLGPSALRRRTLLVLYAPTTLVGILLNAIHISFLVGHPVPMHRVLMTASAVVMGSLGAVYLAIGGAARFVRLRRNPDFDPLAARWLRLGAACMVLPLLAGMAEAAAHPLYFATIGYKPLLAVTICGGVVCAVLAMSRVPIGSLDKLWRRSSGYVLATGLAVALYLALVGGLGGAASSLSGGDFRSALAATLVAAMVFGPVRIRLQRIVDERFGRSRARARRLLRDAAEEAAGTLDIHVLEDGLVVRVREALDADSASLYVERADGAGWSRVAQAGMVGGAATLEADDPLAQCFAAALNESRPRDAGQGSVSIPIAIADSASAVLLVDPPSGRTFDEEERDHLLTVGATFAVALGNARAHTAVSSLNERLKSEVENAEEHRQEIARLKERLEEENRALIGQLAAKTGRAPVIGQGLRATFELVQRVARTDSSVLIRGETGVGKELVARAVHAGSARKSGPFIVVDCGAIAPSLFEAALFGHVRGAFTGAVRDAQGAFRAAHGGTLFLDEIGELPQDLQPKLLRVLQERDFQAIGSQEREAVDVRIISGTNRDLSSEVSAGQFRQDLLYRLRVVEIVVPPLRERLEDIEALALHFLAASAERSGRNVRRLSPEALAALLEYDWPGNVRELEHCIEAALVYAEGEEIHVADLPIFEQLFQQRGRNRVALGSEGGGVGRSGLREALAGIERERLEQTLGQHNGNKTRAAQALGISRGALLRRLKRYGLMP